MGEFDPQMGQADSDYEALARQAGALMSAAANEHPGAAEQLTAFWAANPAVRAALIAEELRFEGQE